MNTALF